MGSEEQYPPLLQEVFEQQGVLEGPEGHGAQVLVVWQVVAEPPYGSNRRDAATVVALNVLSKAQPRVLIIRLGTLKLLIEMTLQQTNIDEVHTYTNTRNNEPHNLETYVEQVKDI